MKNHANATTCAIGASTFVQHGKPLKKGKIQLLAALFLGFALLLAIPGNSQTNCPCIDGDSYEVGDPENPTSVTIGNSGLPSVSLTNGCVVVYGKLVVNQDYTFDGCLLVMEAGAEIEVTVNSKLTIKNGTLLRGCERMWKGITIKYSRLDMEGSTIKNAEYAVKAEHNSRIRMVNNTFDANYVGLLVPAWSPSFNTFISFLNNTPGDFSNNRFQFQSPYLPPYSGQTSNPYIWPYAGILLENTRDLTIGHLQNGSIVNYFDNLRYGIIEKAGFRNEFSGCQMTNLVSPDPAILDGTGILIEKNTGKTTVQYCTMTNVWKGIRGINNYKLDILSNTMAEINAIGIHLTGGKNSLLIESNTVSISMNATGGNCIEISNFSNGTNPIEIEGNTLSLRNQSGVHVSLVEGSINMTENKIFFNHDTPFAASHGVFLNNASGPTLIKKTEIMFPNPNAWASAGIYLIDSPQAQVVDNELMGPSSADNFQYGIVASYSANNLYCCNNLATSRIGVFFDGLCNDTRLKNTTFGNHTIGMLLSYGQISPQSNYGNDWSYANTTKDAVYYGDIQYIPYSSFITDPDLVPNGYAKIEVPAGAMPEEWFSFQGTDPTCQNYPASTYCGEQPFNLTGDEPTEFTELNDLDLDALSPYQGADPARKVLKWEAQRYLYDKLLENPALVNWNSEVSSFFTGAQNGLVGQFHQVQNGIRHLFFPPDNLIQEYKDLLQNLDSLSEAMLEIEQQLLTASEAEKAILFGQWDSLAQQISPLIGDLDELESEIATWRASRIAQLQTLNAAISPVEIFQEYEKTIYGIYLETVAQEVSEFSPTQKNIVDSISAECPSTAGKGVNWARSLRRIYEPEYAWGVDECGESEERSAEQAAQEVKTEASRLFPNPVREVLSIHLSEPLSQEGTVSIYDVNGKMVLSEKLAAQSAEFQVNIQRLPAGIYLCEIKDGQQTVHSNRMAIAD